jgi:hypothetical protein
MFHSIVKEQDFLTGRKGNRQSLIIATDMELSTRFHRFLTKDPVENRGAVDSAVAPSKHISAKTEAGDRIARVITRGHPCEPTL